MQGKVHGLGGDRQTHAQKSMQGVLMGSKWLLWMRRCMGLRAIGAPGFLERMGGLGFAIGAIAFNAHTAKNAAENGQSDAGNKIEDAAGEAPCEIRIEEQGNACVDEHGEDATEGTSRHSVPPAARGRFRPQSNG